MSHNVILVVDDSPDIRILVKRILLTNGYSVLEAASGVEAVQLARRHCPDLIVLDLNLPGMDGLEATRQMRADPALEDVPILAMTAYAVASTAALARRAGCQQVIFKPFDFDHLIDEVTALLAPGLLRMPSPA